MAKLLNEVSHTFNEYLLIPGHTSKKCVPDNVSLAAPLVRYKKGQKSPLTINIPMVSAIMQSVSGDKLAVALAAEGGVSFIFGAQTIEDQADQVDRVKRSENGVITDPFFLSPDHLVQDAEDIMARYKISGVPICENGKLVGIITNRDLRFMSESDFSLPISSVMTKGNLITGPVGTTLLEAQQILRKNKIEKLPIVDDEGNLKGLITIKDIEKAVQTEPGRLMYLEVQANALLVHISDS